MAKNIIIAITGHIGSGKDTITNLIAGYAARESRFTKYNEVRVIRFADPIKKGIAAMFGHMEDFLYNDGNKMLMSPFDTYMPTKAKFPNDAKGVTYGKLHQLFGDKMREIDNNIFVKVLISKIIGHKDKLIIIPDLRFMNEFNGLININENKELKDYRLFIIKLVGSHTSKSKDQRDHNHQSEIEIDLIPNESCEYILNVNTYKNEIMKHMIKLILIEIGIL